MHISASVVQFPVSLSIEKNLQIIESVLDQTHPNDWVLFPEGSVSGYSTDVSFLKQINTQKLAATLEHLRKEASKRKINIWVGACINSSDKWLNAAYGFTADGRTQIYQKINLANHERGVFSAGDKLPVFEVNTPAGKVMVGIQICRELRYPEQWAWLARSGAQVILHLNNAIGDDSFQPVWRSHLISRAAETQRFVLSANNAAPQQVSPTIAIGPDGKVIGEVVSDQLKVLRLDLDLDRVSNLYLDQSRTDVIAQQYLRSDKEE